MGRIVLSEDHGCSYMLDEALGGDILMYHPVYANGQIETDYNKYDWVEWEYFDNDAELQEAERSLAILQERV